MATLVAEAAAPEVVFAAVAEEVGRLLDVDFTALTRYDPDGTAVIVGTWERSGAGSAPPVGSRMEHGGRNVHTLVFRTHLPARVDDYDSASGTAADAARKVGIRSAVGAPISVAGEVWGVTLAASAHEKPLPTDTGELLAGFTDLVATAVANAEAQTALTASRARIVTAADTARRRIERDLHDGAQQRLVSLALRLRGPVRASVPPEADELRAQLDEVASELDDLLDELREIARGLHPAVLAEGGLPPALTALGRRSALPVRLNVSVAGRLSEPIELAAYYTVSEALTNATKYAHASAVDVDVEAGEGVLHVRVCDDGLGGANLSRGSGLVGLTDRVEALGGHLSLHSPTGSGTILEVALPLTDRPTPPTVSST